MDIGSVHLKRYVAISCITLLAVFACHAGEQTTAPAPVQLVRKAVQNEVSANTDSSVHFMFKNQRQTAHLSQVKLIVETRDATAGMLVSQDGRPLTPEQMKIENARLDKYVQNPSELNRKRKQEKEDAEHTTRILAALPDAFLYEPDGTQPGTANVGKLGHDLVRLKFRPNPNYKPPSHVEQVLTGMEGYLLIDVAENRIAEINGAIQKEVGFGWGILGHLDRGGRFLVQQADVGDGHWEATRMELSFTGKVLLVKSLNIRSMDIFSDFRPVQHDLTFAQGVELLKKEVAEMHSVGKNKEPKTAEHKRVNQIKTQAEEQPCCNH